MKIFVPALIAGIFLLSACGSSSDSTPTPIVRADPAPPTVAHIISYGQSLSLGQYSVADWPSDTALPSTLLNVGWMFSGGTRPEDLSSLVPFSESFQACDFAVWNCDYAGETPLSGAMSELQWTGYRLLGSCAGRSGTPIAGLEKGTDPYQRVIDQVQAGKSLAEGPYQVLGIIWIQGDSDPGNTAYAGELEQLVMDLDTDIRTITGQTDPIQFYVCLSRPTDVDAATEQVAAAMPQVHIVCDTRKLQHVSDEMHLTAGAEWQAGQLLGAAMGHVYVERAPGH